MISVFIVRSRVAVVCWLMPYVVSARMRDLLLRAKHLFVRATVTEFSRLANRQRLPAMGLTVWGRRANQIAPHCRFTGYVVLPVA
jgi:hypothetical protein